MARRFLILHGYEGSEPDHWQTWLAGRLRERGQHVRYPDLPEPLAPEPRAWAAALHAELADLAGPLGGQGERVVVCHSLASTLWLREAATVAPEHRVDRVALVAPPCPDGAPAELASFFPVDTAAEALASAAGTTRVVCADDDPFCPEGAAGRWGAPLGLPVDLVTGGGHLNPDAGFGPWSAMEAWCLGKRPAVVGYPDAEPARRDQ